MTLEMPEIDPKGQSAHLCFYLLNAFYFPVLFYSVDACPPQRTYVLTQCATNFTLLPAHLRLYIYVAVNLTVGFNDRRGNSSRRYSSVVEIGSS